MVLRQRHLTLAKLALALTNNTSLFVFFVIVVLGILGDLLNNVFNFDTLRLLYGNLQNQIKRQTH